MQYFSILRCFTKWQIWVIRFISNDLRFSFTVSLITVLLLIIHVARHTFATTVTLANGVPIETVAKMLGHTDIKTTQIYARIVDKKLSSDMDNLAKAHNRKRRVARNQ